MAVCQVCSKAKQYGHNVSHSKRRTKRVFQPNVFRKRVRVNGEIKRVKICAKCIKRAKKFGEVKGKDDAVLGNVIVRLVDWQEMVKVKEVVKKEEKEKVEKREKKEKKVEEKKEVVSVEELVGRNKSQAPSTKSQRNSN